MHHPGHTYITQTGFQKLKNKLSELNQEHVELGHELHEAQEPGEISENSSYTAIWERKQQVIDDMHEITATLRHAELIKKPTRQSRIRIGSEVRLKGDDGIRRYTIVDSVEANPNDGKISYRCPVGESMLGKKIGDQVVIGNGIKKSYTILEIS